MLEQAITQKRPMNRNGLSKTAVEQIVQAETMGLATSSFLQQPSFQTDTSGEEPNKPWIQQRTHGRNFITL